MQSKPYSIYKRRSASYLEANKKEPRVCPTKVTWILQVHRDVFEGLAGLQDLPGDQAKVKARLEGVLVWVASVRDQVLVGLEKPVLQLASPPSFFCSTHPKLQQTYINVCQQMLLQGFYTSTFWRRWNSNPWQSDLHFMEGLYI